VAKVSFPALQIEAYIQVVNARRRKSASYPSISPPTIAAMMMIVTIGRLAPDL
jgi:hypothetical protein